MTQNMWIGGALIAGFLVGRKTSVLSRTVGFVVTPGVQPPAQSAPQTTTAPSGAAVVVEDQTRVTEAQR